MLLLAVLEVVGIRRVCERKLFTSLLSSLVY